MSEPLFHTDCPSCGAPVHVHSATAVTVVCSYCNSMLVREDNSLSDTGRDSALLNDFSPLQIGTMGKFAAQNFSIVGRLQAKYDAGVWNEWYVKFDDGSDGWLSEAGDIHVLVKQIPTPPNTPEFNQIIAGETTFDFSKRFFASDVREIVLEQAAAQGELPFRLPEKYTNRVADWRCESAFLTLDYATTPPLAFLGKTVQLAELSLQNTRDEAQIRQSAGSLKGTRHSENCPSCGSPVHWITGATQTVICPSCSSDLDTSGNTAKLIEANAMRNAQQQALTLPLGKQGKINGRLYMVVGAVRKEEISSLDARRLLNNESGAEYGILPEGWWVEYLLYSPRHGFKWLVETPEDGWSVSETLTDFPRLNQYGEPQGSPMLYSYGGRVSYAAGAFYWHIRAGDVNVYQDYQQGSGKLCKEISREELAWSKSTPVSFNQIATWFNLDIKANAPKYNVKMTPDPVSPQMVWLMIIVFVIVNLPAWIMMGGDDLFFSLIISCIIINILWKGGNSSD
ncbi:DUF4178 domain-containing protein [Wielerella bovis]|uniref:DUF4178 domain-containing protein n=1 Tax=Wielerella bovis TaxID=2917790 RepID=UPI002019489A|nr:DUF4178 domain-containing protein [Wielerella bovis]ULJ63536.1 DUF4178 domain-containing protein [Wielerella bovis]